MERGRNCFWAAGAVFALFVADVLAAKVQVMGGATNPFHLGDTMQFVVLLLAVTIFVAGTLIRERDDLENGNLTDEANAKDT